ncbi:Dabb family protein [Rivibacter subsaxonicus]|uniref:Stress responsive alpha/beta barrel protein n=1 Tax=Rivibacter subsaxonicus TaxID=457575 RepID=A0A4V2FRR1_9BURK|nr:Dabb family protein [Rivibacter subsaxonicus]RZT91419.1 stress responsive alpha/beta barrel protein [Rivibacter subsaxonicus]
MSLVHIVMWRLKDGADAPRFKALLDSCASLVPGMLEFKVGIRAAGLEANVDVVLVSRFADAAALDAYQQHPQHRTVGAELGPLRLERHVLDFESAP